jgi:hypothetical protein
MGSSTPTSEDSESQIMSDVEFSDGLLRIALLRAVPIPTLMSCFRKSRTQRHQEAVTGMQRTGSVLTIS